MVTSTNVELIRLREEQERREDEEAEVEAALDKAQRRQPFADLSKKSTGTAATTTRVEPSALSDAVNARPPMLAPQSENIPRVPPLKLKLTSPDRPAQKSPAVPTRLEPKFQCTLNLDRIDLSMFDISNHQEMAAEAKSPKSDKTSRPDAPTKIKQKTIPVNKPHELQKAVKRFNNGEPKKPNSLSTGFTVEGAPKEKPRTNSFSNRTISIDTTITLNSDMSGSPASVEIITKKPKPQKNKRESSDSEVIGRMSSISFFRRENSGQKESSTSFVAIRIHLLPIDSENRSLFVQYWSTGDGDELEQRTAWHKKKFTQISWIFATGSTGHHSKYVAREPVLLYSIRFCLEVPEPPQPSSISEKDVPSIVENSLMQSIELPSSLIIDEFVGNDPDPMAISPMDDFPSTLVSEILSEARNETQLEPIDQTQPNPTTDSNPMDSSITNLLSEADALYVAQSPNLPPFEDDPVLFSITDHEIAANEPPPASVDDCIIIVECSDDEFENDEMSDAQKSNIFDTDEKPEPPKQIALPPPTTTTTNRTVVQRMSSALFCIVSLNCSIMTMNLFSDESSWFDQRSSIITFVLLFIAFGQCWRIIYLSIAVISPLVLSDDVPSLPKSKICPSVIQISFSNIDFK